MKKHLVLLVAMSAITGGAMAHSGHSHTGKKPPPAKKAKAASVICPVTGDKIASKEKAYSHETYKGKTYYFCCAGCKPMFDKDPEKYIKNSAKGKYDKM